MEFRRYLKERLSQLRANEALNITETTSEGKGIRKVEFNPQTARSLVSVPYHKQIVFNLSKSLKGLDNFLRLEGYDKNKIENVHRRLRGSKVSSPRRDRELNPPPSDAQVVVNPQPLYFYGDLIKDGDGKALRGYLFTKLNDKFYKVYHYDGNQWTDYFLYPNVPYSGTQGSTLVDKEEAKVVLYYTGGKRQIDLNLNLDLGNDYKFDASGLNVSFDYDIPWFCKQLNGPSLSEVIIGDEMDPIILSLCSQRGIN